MRRKIIKNPNKNRVFRCPFDLCVLLAYSAKGRYFSLLNPVFLQQFYYSRRSAWSQVWIVGLGASRFGVGARRAFRARGTQSFPAHLLRPYPLIKGLFFFERRPGSNDSAFCGDGENEFTCDARDLETTPVGTVTSGQLLNLTIYQAFETLIHNKGD